MNKLAQILGIQFPSEIEISSITNTTDKVKEGSIFFALKGTQNHGSKYRWIYAGWKNWNCAQD